MENDFLDALLTLPMVEGARLAPDRRWVAFTWDRACANVDISIVPCDGSAPPVALTTTSQSHLRLL